MNPTEYVSLVDTYGGVTPAGMRTEGPYVFGSWSTATNLRTQNGRIEPRLPITVHQDYSATATLSPRGMASVFANGTNYLLSAWYDSATGNVKVFSAPGVEVTTSATRFTDYTNHLFKASVVKEAFENKDYVVLNFGPAYARVWDPSAGTIAIHQDVTLPGNGAKAAQELTWKAPIRAGGLALAGYGYTFTNSAGELEWSDSGTAPDNNLLLTATNLLDAGDTAVINFGASNTVDLRDCDQLAFVAESSSTYWFSNLKWEISEDNVTYFTLYDPTDGQYSGYVTGTGDNYGTNQFAFAFPLIQIPDASKNAVRYLRVTAVEYATGAFKPPAANITLAIYAMAGTGRVPGGCLYEYTLYNEDTHAESPAAFMRSTVVANLGKVLGRPVDGIRLPDSNQFTYQALVSYEEPSSSAHTAGVDKLRLYRKELIEDANQNLSYETRGIYCQTFSVSAASGDSTASVTDNTSTFGRDATLLSPGQLQRAIPPGPVTVFANGRLFASSLPDAATTNRYSDIWISRFNEPFRFTSIIDPNDPASGARFQLSEEDVRTFATALMGDTAENTIVVAPGANRLYSFEGQDAIGLAPRIKSQFGTRQPYSVCQYLSTFAWLDNQNQIRIWNMNGGADNLSAGKVGRVINAPTSSVADVSGAIYDDRLFLSYKPSTFGRNGKTTALVYDFRVGEFQGYDTWPSGITADCLTIHNNELLMQSENRIIYQAEDSAATQDVGGTDITVAVTWNPFVRDNRMFTTLWFELGGSFQGGSVNYDCTITTAPGNVVYTGRVTVDSGAGEYYRKSIDTVTGDPHGIGRKATVAATSFPLRNGRFIDLVRVAIEDVDNESDRKA